MVKKYRDLTAKYKACRLHSDALYQSHTVQTLFNKFTKEGKKAFARRHILQALTRFRYSLRRPALFDTLTQMLQGLRLQFLLVARRQGRNVIDVPTPIRRNKRDIMNLQTFYSAVQKRRERNLFERLEQELLDLTLRQEQSTTLRQRNIHMTKVYEERVNMQKR